MASIEPISGHGDRVALRTALPLDAPFTLNVFPTNACNFSCSYCAQSLSSEQLRRQFSFSRGVSMSPETFDAVVEQSGEFPRPYKLLSFMGHGEPLLNKHLPAMIRAAKTAGIAERIEIITNGSLLTHGLSDELIDAGVTNLRVSVQGVSAESYKKTSGVDLDFDEFLDRIKYFHLAGRGKGARLFVKTMDCALQPGEEELFYLLFDDKSSRMHVEKVMPVYDGVEATRHMERGRTDRYGTVHKPRLVCPLPFFSLSVWPNGDISSCDAVYKPSVLGNVNDGVTTLRKAFLGERNRAFQFDLLCGAKNSIPGCSKCCAPDDVSHPMDELDDVASSLMPHYRSRSME